MDFTSRRFHLRHWTHPILLLMLPKSWEKLQSHIWRIHELILKKYLELWHPCNFFKISTQTKIFNLTRLIFLSKNQWTLLIVLYFIFLNKEAYLLLVETPFSKSHAVLACLVIKAGRTTWWLRELGLKKTKSKSCWWGRAATVKRRTSSMCEEKILGTLLGTRFFLRTGDFLLPSVPLFSWLY